ncbi:hypothetical protein [Asticcacaulis sp. YBE204]|uniref:hypothetical protein n=1 Tax=Asticcacaulis sp. YBE204 TaxID=1282363 RepID=UPI0003C3EDA8|nr:hypothetical protein [Asticcacaulis sp. YBE204]ESQ76531.1 hypothetical protein AEYBE204_19260 [Asticcacaulis sp. YBE204]
MSDSKDLFPDPEADKKAYLAAQKRRNIAIGLSLFAFVVLVFLVSLTRMMQNTPH